MKESPVFDVAATCRVQVRPRFAVVQTSSVWPELVVSKRAYRLPVASVGSTDVNLVLADPGAPAITWRSHVTPSFLVVSNTRQAAGHFTAGFGDDWYVGEVGSTVYVSAMKP